MAAAALALIACGIAAGRAGGMPGSDVSSVSARQAAAGNTFTAMRDLVQVKRDVVWSAVERARARRRQTGPSRSTDQGDLARVKRDVMRNAVERAGGR